MAPLKQSLSLFIYQVRQEIGKVTWPKRQEVLLTSLFVFVMVFLFSVFFLIIDHTFASLIHFILGWAS